MKLASTVLLTVGLALASACGGAATSGTDAGGRDVVRDDTAVVHDGAALESDAGPEPDGAVDAGIDAPAVDARVDAGVDAALDARDGGAAVPGVVVCRVDTDCRAGGACIQIPYGRCARCTGARDCPTGTVCTADQGCIQPCTAARECPAGRTCGSADGMRVCVARRCVDGCPAEYVCAGGFCARPRCGDGGSCPAPLVCRRTYCVER